MTALPVSGQFSMVDPTHVAAVGPAAAILFARITWRCQSGGPWRASRQMLAQETGLSLDTLRTAVKVLRDHEWVSSQRAGVNDATLLWEPIFAGQPDMGDFPTSTMGISPHPDMGDFPISTVLQDVETLGPVTGPEPALFDTTPKAKSRGTRYSPEFRPTAAHFALAASLNVDLRVEGPQFADHHTAKGSVMKDWDAALRTWIRNAAKFRSGGNVTALPGPADTTWGPDSGPQAALPPRRKSTMMYGE